MVLQGPQNLSFMEGSNVLYPLFRVSFERGSTALVHILYCNELIYSPNSMNKILYKQTIKITILTNLSTSY